MFVQRNMEHVITIQGSIGLPGDDDTLRLNMLELYQRSNHTDVHEKFELKMTC